MIRLFKVFIPTSVVALLLSETVIIFGSYLAATYYVLHGSNDANIYLMDDSGLVKIGIASALILLGLYFCDLYENIRLVSSTQLLQRFCTIIGFGLVAQSFISYVDRSWMLPKWIMIIGSALVVGLLYLWRLLFSTAIWNTMGQQRLLFLGSSPVVFEVAAHLMNRPELGMIPVGYLGEDTEVLPDNARLVRLGGMQELTEQVALITPDRVIVGMRERRECMPVNDLLDLRFSGIYTQDIASLYEITFGRMCMSEIRPAQLIFSNELGPSRYNIQIQHIYSTVIALVGLTLSLPIMIIVAVLVKLTSPGPVLLRQQRVGFRNRNFTVYKFRSMYRDAEARTGAVWATRNDPRITPIGAWLRKLRIDELPQLFNVLRQEMAIVGPRPERPEFVKMLSERIPYYRQRHYVMPGITGWAQINYKYGDTIEDTITKLEYDLYYIKHASLSLDMYIMFHTAKTMLLFRGAQ